MQCELNNSVPCLYQLWTELLHVSVTLDSVHNAMDIGFVSYMRICALALLFQLVVSDSE